MTADTILHRLHRNGREHPNAPAYYVKSNQHWVPTTWRGFLNEVRQAARALIALGVQPGNTTCILGFNRPEWVIFDLATMLVGGAPAGIYTTNSPAEVKYIVEHAESSVILLENEHQWEKVRQIRDQLPNLKHAVMMKGVTINDPMVLDWERFMARGDETDEDQIDEHLNSLQWEQLATLIYTSGTTGPPKGVMLSHKNLAWTAQKAQELLNLTHTDSVLSYLPLSHIAEQMFTIHAAITAGYQVYYAESGLKVAENLREVQPTMIFGVPRVWERFYAGVQAKLNEATGVRAKIAAWAQDVGRRATAVRNRGGELTGLLALQYQLANRLFYSKVKPLLGLGNARHCISGAAPIAKEILEFFSGLDVIIMEVYGQSEGSGPTTTNRPGATKFGTVGQAWPGCEVKLADDGEILLKGDNVFLGYYKNPAATADTLIDGWLYSGDLGTFDEEGFLTITGRKKEIIITSGGKNIAPKNIEAALKNLELIAEAVVIGEGRRYITALLTLEPEAAQRFAQAHGLEGQELHNHPTVIAEVQRQIDEYVNPLFARVEQVRKFRILPRNFTVEDGELTPTLKIKRRVINEHFAREIEEMYRED
ncbi:MAG: long-chain fatty acid--CoA ligase [Chloroflexi bacterium]|nr:MAG: long-chain fatty acid--CoA ligase [Chloroflexota bacterium]